MINLIISSLFLCVVIFGPHECYSEQSILKPVQLLFRHGDRALIIIYPKDINQADKWPSGIEQLTDKGIRQHFELGLWIRRRYMDFLGSHLNYSLVQVRSTDVDRTLMSAESNLAGIFYNYSGKVIKGLKWRPIPIHKVKQNYTRFEIRSYPIFTNCFQYSLLLIGPCLFLIMFFVFGLKTMLQKESRQTDKANPLNIVYIIQLGLPICCAMFAIIEMVLQLYTQNQKDPLLLITYSVFTISLIFVSLFLELKRIGYKSLNIIPFVFWWLINGAYSIKFYNNFIKYFQNQQLSEMFNFLISLVIWILLLGSLIMDSFQCFPNKFDKTTNPEKKSSILSQITYTWMDKFIYQWFKTDMTDETAYDLNDEDKSSVNATLVGNVFNKWRKKLLSSKNQTSESTRNLLKNDLELKKSNNVSGFILMKSLFQVYYSLLFIGWIFKISHDILILALPLILKYLLEYFKKTNANDTWKGILFAFVFFFQGLLASIFENYCFALTNKISVRVRGALINLIYKKTLKLSTESRTVFTAGDIVNMTSVDMEQIMNWIVYSWILISCPFQIIVAIILLYLELGESILTGVAVIATLVPLNILTMKLTSKFSITELIWKDKRMNILSEILNGIKVIKMYTWEGFFNSKITKLRNEEMKNVRNVSICWCITSVMWDMVPFLVMYITFTFYIYVVPSHTINPEKVFVCLVLFNNLQLPILLLPWGLTQAISAFVSFGRIEKLLMAEDKDIKEVESSSTKDIKIDPDSSIEIQNGYFSWSRNGKTILNNINLKIKKQKLTAIIGEVGVGKSSLFSTILGETYKQCGTVQVEGNLALVPQEAWVQNKSLRDNILFTKSYNKSFYKDIIKACCLNCDIETFPMGDKTEIGERGINLSGGQKQRISLARAIYQDKDIYLLDDPLSAVDVNVGQELFNNVISNDGLLKTKTRIFVTHGLRWLPFVDEIVVINSQGNISEKGNYQYLMDFGEEFKKILSASDDKLKSTLKEYDSKDQIETDLPSSFSKSSENKRFRNISEKSLISNEDTNEEEIMNGNVKWNTIFWYFKARGTWVFVFSTIACISFGGLQALGNVWLGLLSNNEYKMNESSNDEMSKYYINNYGIIGIGQCVMVIIFWGGFTYGSLEASKRIHKFLLNSILRGTLSFFDKTPSGRILNRFSKDMYLIDHILNLNITDIINRLVLLLTSFIVITIVTPWFGLTGIPIMVAYFVLQRFYISSSRQSQRLDSKASSVVFTHLMETYKGSSVIKSFKAEQYFENMENFHVDKSNKFKLIQYFCLRWLCLRLDILGNLIVFGSVIFSVINRFNLNASLVGLSISYALQVTGISNWLMRQYSEFETNAVSIERIKEYTMIPSENQFDNEKPLPENWVSNGNIFFDNFSVQYDIDKPLVLKNITLNILPGEKIGIVGRTGAGKSTLSLALFRLIGGYSGKIFIDGLNINSIGLNYLRKMLTILPQDPIIFSGTLRENLDPFNEYVDDQLWQCIDISGLKQWTNTLPGGINYNCGDMGTNLSVGQKQLICLARAMLKKSKIIILDEATASVDEETDRNVIEAIKNNFNESTVIIIAHRLSTIINCDKIVLMENGSVIEFGSPNDLLSNSSGVFRSMVMKDS